MENSKKPSDKDVVIGQHVEVGINNEYFHETGKDFANGIAKVSRRFPYEARLRILYSVLFHIKNEYESVVASWCGDGSTIGEKDFKLNG